MGDKPDSEETGKIKGDPARELATLHHICGNHLKELQTLSKSKVSIIVSCSTKVIGIAYIYPSFTFSANHQTIGYCYGDVEQTQAKIHGNDRVIWIRASV